MIALIYKKHLQINKNAKTLQDGQIHKYNFIEEIHTAWKNV